jgi:hypothetical protein
MCRDRRYTSSFVLIALLGWCCCGAGCTTTTIVPPPPSGDDVAVFVTDYSRHSSLILPAKEGHYNEYAFGDFNWFALSRTSSTDGARALFCSAGSTIGRRQLELTIDDPAAVASDTSAARVIRLEAPRGKVDALREQLDADYFARHDTITYNPASSMWFVRSREPYHGCHNCNHLTARWLRLLGCEIRGTAMFSRFRIAPRP